MTLTGTKLLAATLVSLAVLLLGANYAHAEEAAVSADATVTTETGSANVEASTTVKTETPKPRPGLILPKPIKNLLTPDKREDMRDKREDRRDAATTTGGADRREDARDRMEDKRENLREKAMEMRANVKERLDAVKAKVAEKRVEIKAQLVARAKANIEQFARVLTAAIEREQKLSERVASRIDKLAADGKEVSAAEASLTVAATELAAATADLESLKAKAEVSADVAANASTTPKDAFGEIRPLLESAKKHVRAAHDAIVKAVKSLREISTPKASAEAGTSAEATAE